MHLEIAVYQGPGRSGDVAGNLEVLRAQAARAAGDGARLLVLPELFLTGYNIGDAAGELAEPADGPSARAAAEIAREAGLALIYGYAERDGAAVYNAALLVDRDGRRLANCRKLHLYGGEEQRLFRPGQRLVTAALDGFPLGLLICYDVEFPEAVRALALAGAQLVAVPTAAFHPYAAVPRRMVPVRAQENGIFVAYANRTGREGELVYLGDSSIVGPDGHALAAAGDEEALLRARLEPAAYEACRRENPYLDDLRPEVYAAGPDGPT